MNVGYRSFSSLFSLFLIYTEVYLWTSFLLSSSFLPSHSSFFNRSFIWLEFMIPLSQHPQFWDYRHAPLHLGDAHFFSNTPHHWVWMGRNVPALIKHKFSFAWLPRFHGCCERISFFPSNSLAPDWIRSWWWRDFQELPSGSFSEDRVLRRSSLCCWCWQLRLWHLVLVIQAALCSTQRWLQMDFTRQFWRVIASLLLVS